MADGCRFERKNGPKIPDQECRGGSEYRGEEILRKSPSWKSSPTSPNPGDVSRIRSVPNDQLETPKRGATTGDRDEGEIIASAEEEASPQKFASVPPRQGEAVTNFLGEVERDPGLGLSGVPPTCAASISRSSSSKISPVTEQSTVATEESHEPNESPESISRLSRIDSAKQDMKNLKSATLGRMGKMFKMRPPTPAGRDKTSNNTERGIEGGTAEERYGQDPSRKEKTHSLGRMLRLVDKDGAPRKLFSHTRTGSLTRLRKMHSTVGNAAGTSDDSRNIFTRILDQIRGRSTSVTNAEPNLQSINGPENSPKASLGTRLMMSLSTRGTPVASPATGTAAGETSVERVAVEHTA